AASTLFKAALAFDLGGGKDRLDEVWRALAKKVGKDGLTVGGKALSLEKLKEEVRSSRPKRVERADCPMFGGDATRSASAAGGLPLLDPLWKHALVTEPASLHWLKTAAGVLKAEGPPAL